MTMFNLSLADDLSPNPTVDRYYQAYRDLLSKAEQQMRDHDINTNDYDFIVSYHFDFEKMNVILRGHWAKKSSSIILDLNDY